MRYVTQVRAFFCKFFTTKKHSTAEALKGQKENDQQPFELPEVVGWMRRGENGKWNMDEAIVTEMLGSGGVFFGSRRSRLTSPEQFEIWKWGRKRGLFESGGEFDSLVDLIH